MTSTMMPWSMWVACWLNVVYAWPRADSVAWAWKLRPRALGKPKAWSAVIFGWDAGNEHCNEIVDCSFMHLNGRALCTEEQYGVRLGGLLTADGFIIASGGGAGALVELLAIMNLNQRIWEERPKRTAVLRLPDVPVAWDSDICDMLYRWGYVSPHVPRLIRTVDTPQKAVDWVLGRKNPRGAR